MGELFFLIILITVIVIVIRGGKTTQLDAPLIVDQPGRLHGTIAPQLRETQVFIESIVEQCEQTGSMSNDIVPQFFAVDDPGVTSPGEGGYLLAVSRCAGTWYFQAINPQPLLRDKDSHLNTIREFSRAVLSQHPSATPPDHRCEQDVRSVIEKIAADAGIAIQILQ